MKIFLADTDTQFLSKVGHSLSRAGFDCETVSAASGFHDFSIHHPDASHKGVFLLGAGLSDRSKKNWIVQLKSHYHYLAILMVAEPVQIEAISSLLQNGVDDWVVPSVHTDELIARIALLFRQKYPDAVAASVLDIAPYTFTGFPNQVFRDGQSVSLTAKEYEVAVFLFRHLGQTLSRQRLCEAVWNCPLSETGRTVDTHVSRVRSKLGLKDGVYGYVLEQLYGYGYLLRHI